MPNSTFSNQAALNIDLAECRHPLNYCNEVSTLQSISCLCSIQVCFCKSCMSLNPTKSDAILFGTLQRLKTKKAANAKVSARQQCVYEGP